MTENLLWLLVTLGIFFGIIFGIIVPVTAELGYRFLKWERKRRGW